MLKNLLKLSLALLVFPCGLNAQNNGLAFTSSNPPDPTDDYVSVNAGSGFVANSNEISMTCWVYPTNAAPVYPDYDGFAGFRNNVSADFYLVQLTATDVEARFRNSAGQDFTITSPIITLNTWQHLALTYGNGWLKLYKNGVVADSIAATGTITDPSVTFYMGKVQWTSADFNLTGKMDETSLWSRALTPEELYCMPAEGIDSTSPGLQLLFRCNQGIAGGNNSGITTLIDATGHANGTLNQFAMTGTTSNFVDGASIVTTTPGFTCPDVAYSWNGNQYTDAGIYYDTLSSSQGCDSIVALQLSVLFVDTVVNVNWATLTAHHVGLGYQWLDCGNGNTPISGATGRVFEPTAPGSYSVIVTQGACSDTSGCWDIVAVGLNHLDVTKDVTVQPSITTSKVKVVFAKSATGIKIDLLDVTGKALITNLETSTHEMDLDLSSYSSGIYFIRVKDGEAVGIHRVVKQ